MMTVVTGDRYLESLVKFVENQAGPLIEGTLVLKLNPVGLHYVYSRLEALAELESLLAGAPVDYLRAYVSDLGDHRALEQLRRILRLLTALKVVSVLPQPARDPTPLSLLPFGRLKVLELRGCDLSTSAARGLLELRHTLEKLICHNSTDALRHVFASRIADIKNSPHWNRLSFVSCACNGLVLMDESLQLLPVIETLDLSRNKFTKVDNVRKCNKLKHLDLGFNHLRTVASFYEVSCQIVKLVLRNNALTTLHGIENLKSLEGLDLSYNIISSFPELEILGGLPTLQSLWLEGNPLCSARWYRAQVFSYFPHPRQLKLDEKKICKIEFWKRQMIIARRQKRPAGFGFYSPANDTDLEGTINTKRKKVSRLVSIEREVQSTYICSDEESASCDNEIRIEEENAVSDDEAEINDLMNRIELMKKERSDLWLQEFKQWMNFSSESFAANCDRDIYMQYKARHKDIGQSSRHMTDSIQASGDESSTNILDSDNSFADTSALSYAQEYSDQIGEEASKVFFLEYTDGHSMPALWRMDLKKEQPKSYYHGQHASLKFRNTDLDSSAVTVGNITNVKTGGINLVSIDNMESNSSPARAGSPPHYQVDILHHRHNLEEEFLQLSADSHSVISSDSDTSYSEDDFSEFGPFVPKNDQSLIDKISEGSVDVASHHSEDAFNHKGREISQSAENGRHSYPFQKQNSATMENKAVDHSQQFCSNKMAADVHDGEVVRFAKQEADWLKKKESKRKAKRRVILLADESNIDCETATSQKPNGLLNLCVNNMEDQQGKEDVQEFMDKQHGFKTGVLCVSEASSPATDTLVENYFNLKSAHFGVQETCKLYVCCNCLLEETPGQQESKVVVLLSSEHNLYVLLVNGTDDGSEICLRLIGAHRLEDVREVVVSLGLQVVRLCIEINAAYLFITRSIEKSRQLLSLLDLSHSYTITPTYSIRSFEQVQLNLFERYIYKGSEMSILQYSMVNFWHSNLKDWSEDLWQSRSLFVLKGQLFVCIEDLMELGTLFLDAPNTSYFSLDSCCSIAHVSEMIVEVGKSPLVTLVLSEKKASGPLTWKFKWFSGESLEKFVVLFKAVHASSTSSPLAVRYVS